VGLFPDQGQRVPGRALYQWIYFFIETPAILKNNLSSVARALWTGLAANAIKPPTRFHSLSTLKEFVFLLT